MFDVLAIDGSPVLQLPFSQVPPLHDHTSTDDQSTDSSPLILISQRTALVASNIMPRYEQHAKEVAEGARLQLLRKNFVDKVVSTPSPLLRVS